VLEILDIVIREPAIFAVQTRLAALTSSIFTLRYFKVGAIATSKMELQNDVSIDRDLARANYEGNASFL
jgi:hypothetical protein